jgi:hypothetical protein
MPPAARIRVKSYSNFFFHNLTSILTKPGNNLSYKEKGNVLTLKKW